MMQIRLGFVLVMLLVFAPRAQAQTSTATPLRDRNIPYVPDGHRTQVLDVALPAEGEAPYPVVLLFHGSASSTMQVTPQRNHFVKQGYATVSVDYRETGDIADALSDAFCALAWTHSHSDSYHFDLGRIAAFGYSLGGWQAALLGTVNNGNTFLAEDCPYALPSDSRVQGVITFGGALFTPQMLARSGGHFDQAQRDYLEYLAQVPPTQWDQLLDSAWQAVLRPMPVYWLDTTDAPFLLIHGEDDADVPAAVSTDFADTVNAVGGSVQLVLLAEGGHTLRLFDGNRTPQANAAIDTFLAAVFEPRTSEIATPPTGTTPPPNS